MKKLITTGIITDGKLSIADKTFKTAIGQLKDGKYRLTLEKWYKKSTPPQFGWLYGCIYPLTLIALNDAGYEFTTIDEVDLFWKTLFANKEALNRETGEIVKIPKSKAQFETIDQAVYIGKIRTYCEEYLGVYIPEPDKDYKTKKNTINGNVD